uniref:Uncharacterized protein n=1 Tax=Pararge aegeria TaxID=116150 RepID=S4PS25_9NEOP
MNGLIYAIKSFETRLPILQSYDSIIFGVSDSIIVAYGKLLSNLYFRFYCIQAKAQVCLCCYVGHFPQLTSTV